MKEKFRSEINCLEKMNNKLERLENSTEFSRNGKNDNKIQERSSQKNLQYFISNPNKFNFSSAFDHKGAKSFLKSKGKALKEIILDGSISEEEEEKEEEIIIKKEEKKRRKYPSSKFITKDSKNQIKKYSLEKDKIISRNYLETINNHICYTLENHNKSKKKSKKKKKLVSNKDNDAYLKNFLNKELNVDKIKSLKYCSEIELKMFNDKSLDKLKPIKEKIAKVHENIKGQNLNINKNFNTDYSFVRTGSSNSDSTLINIISEFK